MGNVVKASEFVPSEDEVAVMTDEALMAMHEDSAAKADAIEDEAYKRLEEKPLSAEYRQPLMYEYLIHRATARLALKEVSRRTHESIAKFSPGTIQLQREAERAASKERP